MLTQCLFVVLVLGLTFFSWSLTCDEKKLAPRGSRAPPAKPHRKQTQHVLGTWRQPGGHTTIHNTTKHGEEQNNRATEHRTTEQRKNVGGEVRRKIVFFRRKQSRRVLQGSAISLLVPWTNYVRLEFFFRNFCRAIVKGSQPLYYVQEHQSRFGRQFLKLNVLLSTTYRRVYLWGFKDKKKSRRVKSD